MKKKKVIKGQIYRGELIIGGAQFNCAVNEDGVRIIGQRAMNRAFDRPQGGGGRNLPRIIDLLVLEPFISAGLRVRVNRLIQVEDIKGLEAEILPEICETWLKARDAGVLNTAQEITAKKAEVIMRALSKVGIIALIDEATGFQFDRKYDALRMLLEQYVAEGMAKWLLRFPDKFFEELDRLYGKEKTTSRSRPPFYGGFINTYIYEPIEEGFVKEELNKKNISIDGKRKGRFHQWLTDFGVNQLTIQIGRVMGVMEISPNLRKFKDSIARQKGIAIQPDFFKD